MKPMLAKCYDAQDIKGWLMSEKLDGVRAIWTGSELISRNGNKFFAPLWFTEELPAGVMLDGELFIGRNQFQRCVSIVRKQKPVDSEWEQLRFFVFDAPGQEGGFEERLAFCSRTLFRNPVAEVVEHTSCRDLAHLNSSWILFSPVPRA